MDCGIITEEKEEMILIPKRDYIRYIENEKTLDNIRKIVTDSDTEKWKGISIFLCPNRSQFF